MKSGIEAMIQMVVCLIGFLFVLSVFMISLAAADARQYHVWVMEKLEGARYAPSVQEECIREAGEQGYELVVRDDRSGGRACKQILLTYRIRIPFAKKERRYQICGYSYWKGGEEA